MSAEQVPWMGAAEEMLAELTDVAYQVFLRHGLKGSFLKIELELWHELRAAFGREVLGEALIGPRPREDQPKHYHAGALAEVGA
jgi:hypothetical protein